MNIHGLLKNCELRWVDGVEAAGSSIDSNSARIDMSNYESVTFVTEITDSVDGGVATLKIEENDADADSGMTAVTGASAAATSEANDDLNDTLLAVEYANPNKQFVQAVRVSATQNIAFGPVLAILRPRVMPATQGATVSASAAVAG